MDNKFKELKRNFCWETRTLLPERYTSYPGPMPSCPVSPESTSRTGATSSSQAWFSRQSTLLLCILWKSKEVAKGQLFVRDEDGAWLCHRFGVWGSCGMEPWGLEGYRKWGRKWEWAGVWTLKTGSIPFSLSILLLEISPKSRFDLAFKLLCYHIFK